MALAKRKVKAALRKKGFDQNEKKDHIYFYHRWKSNGFLSGIWTRVSHGSRPKDLPKGLVGEMARQVKLSNKNFKRLVSCDMDREEYEEVVKKRP